MTALGGWGGEALRTCVHVCILFACTLCRVACRGHTWEGGTVLCLHSLCQARWLLSLRQEVEQWEEKCKDGGPKPCQSGLSPEPPHLETTCSWLTLLPLSSFFSLMFTFSFSRWRRCVFTGCDLCLYVLFCFFFLLHFCCLPRRSRRKV